MTFKKLRIRSVKDELLAWIKEGASGSEIQNQLLGENYKDLLVNLTAEEKVATQKSVRAVAEFLDVHARWFSSLRARSIFVYQLASLSFERLSLWIPKIAAYYRLKEKELERQIKTACKAHWDIQHQTVQNTPFPFSPSDTCGIVPSHLKEQWEQEKPNIRLYVGIEERIREQRKGIDVVTNTNKRLAQKVEEQISLYRGTCSLLVKSLHKIAVNNQMPPIATEIYLMQGDDYLDDVVDGGTEADLKLRQKVLDEVCTVYTKDHTLIKEKISTVVASFVGIKSHEVKFHSAEHGEGHDIEVRVHYTNPQGETQHTAIAFTIRCTLDPLPEI